MPRRPFHLRWIYVQENALLFAGLVLAALVAIGVAAFTVSGPARGLIIGAVPVVFGAIVWALTNQAGYPNRDPESLPHERPEVAEDGSIAPAWDPFAGQRRFVPQSEVEATSGDPFAEAAQGGSALPGNGEPVRNMKAAAGRAPEMTEKARPTDKRSAPPGAPEPTKPASKPASQKPTAEQPVSKPTAPVKEAPMGSDEDQTAPKPADEGPIEKPEPTPAKATEPTPDPTNLADADEAGTDPSPPDETEQHGGAKTDAAQPAAVPEPPSPAGAATPDGRGQAAKPAQPENGETARSKKRQARKEKAAQAAAAAAEAEAKKARSRAQSERPSNTEPIAPPPGGTMRPADAARAAAGEPATKGPAPAEPAAGEPAGTAGLTPAEIAVREAAARKAKRRRK